MKIFLGICISVLTSLLLSVVIWIGGSNNPVIPAGYVGYVTQHSILGKTEFVGTLTGPTSTGRLWLINTTNISVTPYTFDETFIGDSSVLSQDNLKVGFAVHIIFRIKSDSVKQFMEQYSTLDTEKHKNTPDNIVEVAYKNFLKEPLRTYARDEIQKHKGLDIKQNIDTIGTAIDEKVKILTKNTPYDVSNLVVGNIQYPSEVADAVSQKLATVQILERKATEVQIEEMEAKKRVTAAKGIAESMDIINQKLTFIYVQHEAVEAQKAMVNSPNHTTIYIPVGNLGLPLVETPR